MTGIYGALFSGVTALNSQSQSMAALSDNISDLPPEKWSSVKYGF
jgi:hypothetical protein